MAVTFDASATSVNTQAGSSPLAWNHTCGATADWLLAAWVLDGSTGITPANNPISSATYNAVAMTSQLNWQSGGTGLTAGYMAVYSLKNPSTGAADSTTASFTVTGMDGCIGGSGSVISGGGTLGTPVHSDSGGSLVTSGSITVNPTTNGSLICVFVTNGSGGTSFSTGTQQFAILHTGTAGGASWSIALDTIAGTGGSVTTNWTQTSDDYAAIAIEVLPPSGPVTLGPQLGRQLPNMPYYQVFRTGLGTGSYS